MTLRGQIRRIAMTTTTCADEASVPSKERLLLWGSLAGCVVLAIVCVLIFFSLRKAVSERDFAYARADAAEAKSTQEAMRAAALDIKLSAKQVQLQLAADQVAQIRAEMLSKEQTYMRAQMRSDPPAAAEHERAQRGPVPIDISFNRGAGGAERVGVFTNVSAMDLTVVVELSNATNAKQARFTLDIPARNRKEIAPRDGWQFARGDNITTISSGFETSRVTVQ
ncbi:MAG: hypothetical protein ACREYB_06395 [Casimicrobiaceae bacterium]